MFSFSELNVIINVQVNINENVRRVEMERKGERFMTIPVEILFPGTKIHIGKRQYIVNDVVHLNGLVRVIYKTDKGLKTKSFSSADRIKISLK